MREAIGKRVKFIGRFVYRKDKKLVSFFHDGEWEIVGISIAHGLIGTRERLFIHPVGHKYIKAGEELYTTAVYPEQVFHRMKVL
jgi:hypothetical protein